MPDLRTRSSARASWPVGTFELAGTDLTVTAPSQLPANLTWRPAVVPGGVHESLIASGELAHPFLDENEVRAAWIEERAWWYRTEFTLSDRAREADRLQLVFHGLDTVASVWLNGTLLGTHENAFRPAAFDLTGTGEQRNTLVVRFAPPLVGITAPAEIARVAELRRQGLLAMRTGDDADPERSAMPPGVLSTGPELTLRRKPTFSWGWDFAPRLPSIGIHAPVEIVAESRATITAHHAYARSVDPVRRRAVVQVDVEAETAVPRPETGGRVSATAVLTAPDGRLFTTAIPMALTPEGIARGTAQVTVEDAQLWWTHDLGEQPLYTLTIALTGSEGPIDQVTDRIGLRTMTLDRSADTAAGGRLFRFLLNGTPIYARGANWIPASMFIGSIPESTYRNLVELARHSNMNMLRVWGGGTYEHESFYDACDELGILVWQDFMFACTDYPSEDPGLHSEVAQEATFQVRRLRNHPSLALWCGNNEIEGMHALVTRSVAPGNWGWHFFHKMFPETVARDCPSVPYWPGSPWADVPLQINGVTQGDRHAWEVWHGADIGAGGPTEFPSPGAKVHWDRYRYDHGKFISEFGIHAAPELATLQRWTAAEPPSLGSAGLLQRIKDVPKNKGEALMSYETGTPSSIEQFVDFSMACQAEGLKFGVEHYRHLQPSNNGALVWQFNDCWPGMSWSVIDYDLVPKAGYYALQRAFAPVLASFHQTDDGGLQLWVTNSTPAPVRTTARIELAEFAGARLWDELVPVDLGAMESRQVWHGQVPGTQAYAWVSSDDGCFPDNRLFFDRLKNIDFSAGRLKAAVERNGRSTASVTLASEGFTYMARVSTGTPGCRYNSNYVDLRDGDQHTIEIAGLPTDFDLRDLHIACYGPRPTVRP
ncbi:sugar-binding domain-containing protein [Streptacidiphilus sp. N1-10]|uniref:Beta-mannosidase B n=1 Tax=Streptacidiphilus jeojiensis TaxID=3229225 RepID=A0ABV6XXU8_9ACTN